MAQIISAIVAALGLGFQILKYICDSRSSSQE